MKIVQVGPYLDGTGWGRASLDYLYAMATSNLDVVARNIKLNDFHGEPEPLLKKLLSKDAHGAEVVIQRVLPVHSSYDGRVKNICSYVSETSRLPGFWVDKLNLMDECWVPCEQNIFTARDSGVTVPIRKVPHATDTTKYERPYEVPVEMKSLKDNGDFVFYTVGEFVRRKNMGALVRAFHLAFSPDEPVSLFVKTSIPGLNEKQANAKILDELEKNRFGMKLYGSDSYRKEVVCSRRMTEEEIMGLHQGGDCFVSTSFAEAWCQPAMDAMGMGKTPIVPEYGGFLEWMNDLQGYFIPGRMEPAFGAIDTFPDLYTSRESWFSVGIIELSQILRRVYEARDSHDHKQKAISGSSRVFDFSYRKIGKKISDLLGAYDGPKTELETG